MIIKRYLWKELLITFSAVFLVLMLILAGHTFVRYMGSAAAGEMAADIARTLAPDAQLILSGILDEQADWVS